MFARTTPKESKETELPCIDGWIHFSKKIDKYITPDIWQLVSIWQHWDKGFLPESGGTVDQVYKTMQAISYFDTQKNSIKDSKENPK